ncbi:MAG: hypothetical protein ING24_13155 [Roseomonas sp.]|nr:hypothetical protein [Roseomonas sp.]MCA3343375.1 hypothetical protein [Roseomonas sp.]
MAFIEKSVFFPTPALDGFYAVYMASRGGEALAVITIDQGVIRGAGLDATCYDGSLSSAVDGFVVSLHVSVPAELSLVQGGSSGSDGQNFVVSFRLPSDFAQRDFISIETPHGLVNAKFRRLRGLK